MQLLADDFTGMIPDAESQKPADRQGWPAVRGGLGEPVTLGNISVSMVGSEKGDATVTFYEQTGTGETCRARTRELTLAIHSSGALRVRVVTASDPTPCGAQTPSQVAAAHQHLVKLWKDEDRLEAASTTPSVWLRDFGLDVRTYDRESLHQGDGRWFLKALAEVEATEDNTSRVGTIGEVKGSNGLIFSYHWTQEKWTLQGLDRVN